MKTKKAIRKKSIISFYEQLVNTITSAFRGGTFKQGLFGSSGINTKTNKILAVFAIAFLILQIFNGLFLPQSSVASNGNLCSVAVDAVLIMDVSGSMVDGGAPSKCEWAEIKEIPGEGTSTWFLNTKYNVSEQWCTETRDGFDESYPVYQYVATTYTPALDSKIVDAKVAANSFIDKLQAQDQSALVSFSSIANLVKVLSNDHPLTKTDMDALTTGGATNIGGAIEKGADELGSVRANPQAAKVMILLTDGQANKPNGNGYDENPLDVAYALSEAQAAAGLGYKIFTIGLGSDGEINQTMLQQIASSTAARYYHAPNGTDLGEIYDEIAWELCQYGSISGCKYSDVNKDGNISGEEKISGWEINLNNDENFTQHTDGSGCYRFSGLAAGTYTISEGGKAGVVSEQTYPVGGSYTIDLAESEHVIDKDFGNYLPVCGNSFKDTGYPGYQDEECDDGNTNDGDSCSAVCQIEISEKEADLAVTKTADDNTVDPGQTVTFIITVLNDGPDEAVGAVLNDLLPNGLSFIFATSTQGAYASSTGAWTIGNLVNNASSTLQLTAAVDQSVESGVTITNVANAVLAIDKNLSNNSATVSLTVNSGGDGPSSPKADLAVTKAIDDATVDPGQTVTFTIGVINIGPDAAPGVILNDLLPAGLTFVSATSTIGSYASSTGAWTIGNMAKDASSTLEIIATAHGNPGQTITNNATVTLSIDYVIGNNSASVTLTINTPPGTGGDAGGGSGGGGGSYSIAPEPTTAPAQATSTPVSQPPGEVKGESITELPGTGLNASEPVFIIEIILILLFAIQILKRIEAKN